MLDLPHVIQLSELTRFVEELRSTEASFHPSQSDSITDEFLRTVNHVREIYSTSDMDVFFRAVYKFFKRQVHESEPLPEGLQRLGKTYSKVSRTRALLNCMSRLQDAQRVYNEAQETYYQKVQALLREEIHARDAAYQKAMTLLQADCVFNEFGTRRRRSARTQELVMRGLLRAERDYPGKGKVNGTSNVTTPQISCC